MERKRRRPHFRTWLIGVVCTALAAVGISFVATSAQAASGCQVDYSITNTWPGGFGANVSVTNLGTPITSWQLSWAFATGQSITQLWSGTYTQSGTQVSVTNASYNGSLATGGSTSFGFNGTYTATNPIPTTFTLNGTTCTGTVTTTPPTSPTTTPPTSPTTTPPTTTPPTTFSNPVLWEDLADADVLRVGDTYYYSASTMHYSPGAPILRSYDLVHWEFAGHSVPSLDFGEKYNLNGNGRAYVNGVWASFLNYRKSSGKFYWGGCIDFNKTYMYTASSVEGPWTRGSVINNCYYDAGMLVDDDDTMYVAYGSGTHSVAQLSADGLSQVRSQTVFTDPSSTGTTEGNRMYKVGGAYYILVDHPANAEYVLKSTNGPFGPYTEQPLLNNVGTPIVGGGVPHQGGIVQTQNGDWYYMAFVDSYPGGRVPVLAPIKWNSSGWPVLQTVNGGWGATYPYPNLPAPPRTVKSPTGTDTFTGPALGPEWEWNHNPDNTKWSANNGLTLQTATVTSDLYSARNTLTHRILGPTSTATVPLDYSGMHDGDRAGLALLRNSSAWIGVRRDNGTTRLVMTNNITMDGSWNTTSTGTEVASTALSGGNVWLRVNADIHPGTGRQGHFSYSTDGVNFTAFGPGFTMDNSWQFFMGYRFALFNYATQALGGSVKVGQFTLSTP
ncbi:family 43 glycosylhydrolase [Streptomyces sp. NPDC020983]|uniref:family 43 glycosylhydrolase n=1 Tax=Streptomyces sp. NPDC020983 TaxID=3365106 RepID=UPI00379E42C1